MAYVSQQAWIQNSTVRDNVVFGQPYQRERYNAVIKACQLERDLSILTAGDMTEIGEKVRGRTGERHLSISILQTGNMMEIGEKVRGRGRAGLRDISPSCRLVT